MINKTRSLTYFPFSFLPLHFLFSHPPSLPQNFPPFLPAFSSFFIPPLTSSSFLRSRSQIPLFSTSHHQLILLFPILPRLFIRLQPSHTFSPTSSFHTYLFPTFCIPPDHLSLPSLTSSSFLPPHVHLPILSFPP